MLILTICFFPFAFRQKFEYYELYNSQRAKHGFMRWDQTTDIFCLPSSSYLCAALVTLLEVLTLVRKENQRFMKILFDVLSFLGLETKNIIEECLVLENWRQFCLIIKRNNN